MMINRTEYVNESVAISDSRNTLDKYSYILFK